jgi:hypothetical protein
MKKGAGAPRGHVPRADPGNEERRSFSSADKILRLLFSANPLSAKEKNWSADRTDLADLRMKIYCERNHGPQHTLSITALYTLFEANTMRTAVIWADQVH